MYNYHILGRLAQERQRELQREAAQAHLAEMVVCDGAHSLGQLIRRLGQMARETRPAENGSTPIQRPARPTDLREDWAEAK
jgi:hypothetical protein